MWVYDYCTCAHNTRRAKIALAGRRFGVFFCYRSRPSGRPRGPFFFHHCTRKRTPRPPRLIAATVLDGRGHTLRDTTPLTAELGLRPEAPATGATLVSAAAVGADARGAPRPGRAPGFRAAKFNDRRRAAGAFVCFALGLRMLADSNIWCCCLPPPSARLAFGKSGTARGNGKIRCFGKLDL